MSEGLRRRAEEVFREQFGRSPHCVAVAPGRVNLIGEHTDYNGGHVLPMAVDRHVAVAADASRRPSSRAWSSLDGQMAEFDPAHTEGWQLERWARYVAGAGAMLAFEGARLAPADLAVVSDLPVGAGLSSSAALEVASALAFLGVASQESRFDRRRLAQLCQKAEHLYAGVKCGIMDQFAVACAEEGRAMYLDCNSLFVRQVPLPSALAVLVVDSRVPRRLAEAEYNERRGDCEEAARKMSAELGRRVHLAEVSHDELQEWGRKVMGERQFRRARHVVGEELRSARAVEHLRRGQLEAFGELARESHRSLAEDFEVSCPELDKLVSLACGTEGVYGARLTGAGFGGSAVVFCAAEAAETVADELAVAYEAATGHKTRPMRVVPAAGARLERGEE